MVLHQMSENITCTRRHTTINSVKARRISVNSTLFQHKSINLQTQTSPDGLSADQIDHVITDSCHTFEITDVKSCTGADHDSNY